MRSIGCRSSWQLFSMSIFSSKAEFSKHGLRSFSCLSKHTHLERETTGEKTQGEAEEVGKRAVRPQASTQTMKERRGGGGKVGHSAGGRAIISAKQGKKESTPLTRDSAGYLSKTKRKTSTVQSDWTCTPDD